MQTLTKIQKREIQGTKVELRGAARPGKAEVLIHDCSPQLLWRFAAADGTSRCQLAPQELNVKYTIAPDVIAERGIYAGYSGFHASYNPADAFFYGRNCFAERVVLSGIVHADEFRAAASERITLWRVDVTHLLYLYGAECAERALKSHTDNPTQTDPRSFAAVAAVREFAAGLRSQAEMQPIAMNALAAVMPERLSKTACHAANAAYHAAAACSYNGDDPAFMPKSVAQASSCGVQAAANQYAELDAMGAWLLPRLLDLEPKTPQTEGRNEQ